jgi:hypothetical protein
MIFTRRLRLKSLTWNLVFHLTTGVMLLTAHEASSKVAPSRLGLGYTRRGVCEDIREKAPEKGSTGRENDELQRREPLQDLWNLPS